MENNPVPIPDSHLSTITSVIVNGHKYDLHIHLPLSYAKEGSKKYPVVYLLDSQWNFPSLTSSYSQQYYDGFIPEVIIVGISWAGNNQSDSRFRDFFPSANGYGGAENFLSFLERELFPFIETNYFAVSENRTIVGNSASGFFVLYSLFTAPMLFSNYIGASISFDWDNEIIYKYEEEYYRSLRRPKARLYMVHGGVENNVLGFEKLVSRLKNREYSSLDLETKILENTGHGGSKTEGFSRGLQFVFKPPNVTVHLSLLKIYEGVYIFAFNQQIEIRIENGILVLYYSDGSRFELLAKDNSDFYSNARFLKIHFNLIGNLVDELVVEEFNNTFIATRRG